MRHHRVLVEAHISVRQERGPRSATNSQQSGFHWHVEPQSDPSDAGRRCGHVCRPDAMYGTVGAICVRASRVGANLGLRAQQLTTGTVVLMKTDLLRELTAVTEDLGKHDATREELLAERNRLLIVLRRRFRVPLEELSARCGLSDGRISHIVTDAPA